MIPNVSRFLIRWDVDKIIGDNLVSVDEFNTYTGPEPRLIARTDPRDVLKQTGFPWYVLLQYSSASREANIQQLLYPMGSL